MNRLLTSTIIFVLILSGLNTCSAESKESSEHVSIAASEELSNKNSELKSTNIDFEEDYQSKLTSISSKSSKDKSKKEENIDLWAENQSGKRLNTLKGYLEELQLIYNKNYKAFCIGEAINNTDPAEKQQKRNTTLLLNINRQTPFSIYAASYVFPELLKLNLQFFTKNILETEKNLSDEIAETPEEIDIIIHKLSDNIKNYKRVGESFQKLTAKTEESLNNLKKQNKKLQNLSSLGFYVKKTNDEILNLVSKQADSLEEIIVQLELAFDYCEKQITFMNQHNLSLAEKLKYFAEIRSYFKDLEKFIEKYDVKQSYNAFLLNKAYSEYYNNLKEFIGNEEIRSGRIKYHIKRSRFVPVPSSIDTFNAKDDLDNIFKLFDLTEIDKPLHSALLQYIGNESWHIRYKDEEETKKSDKKPMPKLIDFEEE